MIGPVKEIPLSISKESAAKKANKILLVISNEQSKFIVKFTLVT